MNLSASAPTSVRTFGPMPKVGELSVRFRADESLHLGHVAGPDKGFSSLQDALSSAAGLSQERRDGSAFAIVEQGGRFQAHQLLQPVWSRSFAREDALGYDASRIELLDAREGRAPKFGFFSYRQDRYGRTDKERTGQVVLDATRGVQAVVGRDWALVDGRLQAVEPRRPERPTPPVDPRPPVDPTPDPGGRGLVEDVTEAARLANEAVRIIGTVPPTDTGDESTKDLRIKAYRTNMAAQARIERQFDGSHPADVLSTLRSADASLEDANWQLAKKPSPDGRFTGVDVPGALRDSQRAVELLQGLLDDLVQPSAA